MEMSDICIVNNGIASPTGTDATMSIANVLAGIHRKQRFPLIEDSHFNPVTLGIAEYLDQYHVNSKRMLLLSEKAFEEVIQDVKDLKLNSSSIPIYLGLSKPRPGLDSELIPGLEENIYIQKLKTGLEFKVEFIREDHDSGMIALSKAVAHIQAELGEFVIIGGVESYVSEETVEWLEEKRWLKCSSNRNGFSPGEAASYCLLCTRQTARKYHLPIKAVVCGVASAEEPHLVGSETPTRAEGISTAMKSVLQYLPETELIEETFCTLRGLRREAEEYSFTVPRTGKRLKRPGEFTTLVSNWGDIGAASAPALLAYATEKCSLGFSDPGYNLIFTMSPGGLRSAALIQTL